MGRIKLDMKKIEDTTKNQITYSKRRNGLFKKINELSVLCDVDVAIVTFSPSGRLYQFPKRKIISEVLKRYIDLPLDQRNYPIEKPQHLVDQLGHIKDHGTKHIFVKNEIKRFEKQIATSQLELQMLEAELRSFDRTLNEGTTTLTEIHWQQDFLHGLLKQLMDKKMGIERNNGTSLFNAKIEDLNRGPQFHINNSKYDSVLKQADPWVHSSRTQYGHSYPGLLNQTMGSPAADYPLQATANIMNNNNSNSSSSFSSLYQPMLHQETLPSEIQAATDDVSAVMFDPDEINWLNSIILNNSDNQNPNVPQTMNSPRVSAPTIYDPMFEDMGLHVDPFLREYHLNNDNNNNNNLEDDSRAFHQEEMPHQDGIPAFQASPLSDPSSDQIWNLISIMSNQEEDPWTDFPPIPSDQTQFHELLLEDKMSDEVLKTTDTENKNGDDTLKTTDTENKDGDDTFNIDEYLVDIQDIMIDVSDLGSP